MEQNMELNNGVEVVEPQGEPEEVKEKLFTQEQVNEIVKKRLERQKENGVSLQDIETRQAELVARESRLDCREYLHENGYPAELLDIIDTSDVEAFKKKADKASGIFQSRQDIAPLASTEPTMYGMSSAFGETKHTPKTFPPR